MKSVVAIILTLLLTVAIGATADSIQAGNVGIRRHEGMFRRAKSNDNQSHNKWHGNNGNDNADKGEKDDGDHEGRNDKGSGSSDNDDVEHYLVVRLMRVASEGFITQPRKHMPGEVCLTVWIQVVKTDLCRPNQPKSTRASKM